MRWRLSLLISRLVRIRRWQQDGWFGRGERRRAPAIDISSAEYDGRFSFVRLRYGGGGGLAAGRFIRREPPWAHDFPRADFNFLKILGELTFVRSFVDQGNIRTLDDPDLAMFPMAYMSEPGFWVMDEAEMEGFRAYLQKGGFVIFDDFRENHMYNLIAQMKKRAARGVVSAAGRHAPDFSFFFRNQFAG